MDIPFSHQGHLRNLLPLAGIFHPTGAITARVPNSPSSSRWK